MSMFDYMMWRETKSSVFGFIKHVFVTHSFFEEYVGPKYTSFYY